MQDIALARSVVDLLGERAIATAESCTAGRVAEVLAAVEGASGFFRGGLVAYQDEVKRDLLGLTAESVFTRQAAEEMARGAARLFTAAVTVATTGVAGDSPTEGTAPGTVYIATYVDGDVDAREHRFEGDPEEVCDQARRAALTDLVRVLEGSQPSAERQVDAVLEAGGQVVGEDDGTLLVEGPNTR
jgi:nicotinamide-nucleotide amidase